MGAKGTSINTTDISATYIMIKNVTDQIRGFTADIDMHKKGVLDEIQTGSIDTASASSLEELLKDLSGITSSSNAILDEINAKLDAGLKVSFEIKKRAQQQANAVQENVGNIGKKFKR